ncbi:MAG: NAD(P)H-quinone oxidoreductase [Gammaproteobacteria bacterium]
MPKQTMQAVCPSTSGGPEVLKISDVAIPVPTAQQLLIKVHATALNRADILQREGKYPPPLGESNIPGLEIAGEVIICGAQASGFKSGQRVFGLVGSGGYAEYCLLDHRMAMPMPDHWEYGQAAAVPEVFFTASETLFELGQLQSGEKILIHAGGSGVGTAAIQMAHHVGAQVYITAGSAAKIEKTQALGAKAGINYKTEDYAQEILRLTAGEGVDVVEDFIGQDYFARNLAILKPEGRLIQVAVMSGRQVSLDLSILMMKRLQIKGFILRSRSLEQKREITQRFSKRWVPLLISAKIKPIIDSVFPLAMIQEAHRYLQSNQHFGKVIISMDEYV